jgi:hypothetical protein
MSNSTSIMAGGDGFKYHGTGTVTSVGYAALVVQEDTVFTSFSVDGTNVLSARGLSGITLQQGAYLPSGGASKITGFIISSGSVIGY